ncbi:MAG: hypothetical protein P8013_08600 [Candidatus Sulfobium sp.]
MFDRLRCQKCLEVKSFSVEDQPIYRVSVKLFFSIESYFVKFPSRYYIYEMLIFRLAAAIIIQMAIWGALLFLPAGTLGWWRAWVLLGIILLGFLASAASLFPSHRGLLAERLRLPLQKGQPLVDRIVLAFLIISFYGLLAFIPADVFRLHLMA